MMDGERVWQIIVTVTDGRVTWETGVGCGKGPTVGEALQALEAAKQQLLLLPLPAAVPSLGASR
jgi:hypothetical protein